MKSLLELKDVKEVEFFRKPKTSGVGRWGLVVTLNDGEEGKVEFDVWYGSDQAKYINGSCELSDEVARTFTYYAIQSMVKSDEDKEALKNSLKSRPWHHVLDAVIQLARGRREIYDALMGKWN